MTRLGYSKTYYDRVMGAHTLKAVLREAGWQAGFGKQGNKYIGVHTLRAGARTGRIPALSVWTPMNYRVYQTLPASQPASFSHNCSQCVGTLSRVKKCHLCLIMT